MTDLIKQIIDNPDNPFGLLYRPAFSSDKLEVLQLSQGEAQTIEAALTAHASGSKEKIVLMPFCQVAKRGYKAVEDDTPILSMPVLARQWVSLPQALNLLPDVPIVVKDTHFNLDDAQFGKRVSQLIDQEIGEGAGSNFVLHRKLRTTLVDYQPNKLLSLYRRLLQAESSAYWCFLINTGEQAFIGVSPELHASLHDGKVCMNPISGTFRYPEQGETIDALRHFLSNQKETNELYMVVDEELKVMSRLCENGAQVSELRLKQLSHVIHTEYWLTGTTRASIADILRETLPAPTVIGSPVQNACEVIARYEPEGRRYYSGVVALVDSSPNNPSLDSAICIRTAEISTDGKVEIGVGATIVRDSIPLDEAEETRSKAHSLYAALTQDCALPGQRKMRSIPTDIQLSDHPLIHPLLASRNAEISQFWLTTPEHRHRRLPHFLNKKILILDGNDTFTAMFQTLFSSLGASAQVEKVHSGMEFHGWDLIVAGPGPGNPLNNDDMRVSAMHEAIMKLRITGQPFFAVCLSHQLLCLQLGLSVIRLSPPNQGIQKCINLDGQQETVGFYNTFCAMADRKKQFEMYQKGISVYSDQENGLVHAVRAAAFSSVQFHLESILTINGPAILERFVSPLLQNECSGMAS
ncbi:anthranilate synthase family protein [Pantoea sp. FN0307]|uniref:anthranilate synthase family protein n=1 Tax=Pantoea sp. FN0307 TaxID=3418560 RepID=UPI003CE9DED2